MGVNDGMTVQRLVHIFANPRWEVNHALIERLSLIVTWAAVSEERTYFSDRPADRA